MKLKICSTLLMLSFLLSGCASSDQPTEEMSTTPTDQPKPEEPAYLEELIYTNLADAASKQSVKQDLLNAGVFPQNIDDFLKHVADFYQIVGDVGLVESGYDTSPDLTPDYDIATLSTRWQDKYPIFPGYNCRTTTYGLLKDFVRIQRPELGNSDNLFIDKDALKTNPEKIFSPAETAEFLALFSRIETGAHKDVVRHAEVVKQDWKEKGVEFLYKGNGEKASFIFVFFHSAFNENDVHLFIGHAGVLAPTADGKLVFVEKLAYEEPYQAVKFNNRTELNDYLMNRYDVEWGQPNAKPFIFEADELLSTYRPNPNNVEG